VIVEALVLRGYQRVDQVGRHVVVGNEDAVLTVVVPRSNDLAIGRVYL
jgi:predicted RNA binding protein YcfA (HicA-like mRNA interferase family)